MACFNTCVILAGAILVTTLPGLTSSSTVAPPGGECEARFMQGLFTCFHDHHVKFNSYLWAVGNGTGGVAPKNETEFREIMCSAEESVVTCVLDTLHALVDTVHCHSAEGMQALLTVQVRAIFEEYDNYCAHDCRQTLEASMKQCYQDLDLNPDLFTPSKGDGAILGKTADEVEKFCSKSDALITCLRKERDACPEAAYVMKRIGLDLDTLTNGLQTLCGRQEVYLSSLDCFRMQTRSVEKCHEDHALTLMRLVSKAKVKVKVRVKDADGTQLTPPEFLNNFCLARLQFIKCDLQAWAAKPEEACDPKALSLKRDIHCGQIPRECLQVLQGPTKTVCSHDWAQTPRVEKIQGSRAPSAAAASVVVAGRMSFMGVLGLGLVWLELWLVGDVF